MTTSHPSEEELQAYAANVPGINSAIALHVGTCANCRLQVAFYHFMAVEVKKMPAPTFEFDLVAEVLAGLPDNGKLARKRLDHLLSAGAVILTLIALFTYREELVGLFAGSSFLVLFVTCTGALIFVGSGLWDNYQQYRRTMRELSRLPVLQP